MINKKNLLGKEPETLGDKDAIHTAIVAVRAGVSMPPGTRCRINEDREAVADAKGVGVADPFRRKTIVAGRPFWLLLGQEEIPNVRHEWDHPEVDFSPPAKELKLNRELSEAAGLFGITYWQLIDAMEAFADSGKQRPWKHAPVAYPGKLTPEEVAVANERFINDLHHDCWYAFKDETLYDFQNNGSDCCPEYLFPKGPLFAAPSFDELDQQ